VLGNLTRFYHDATRQPEWRQHLPLGLTTAKNLRYLRRPEAIESVFVMYRITGNVDYMHIGWEMFTTIANGTRTASGAHAAVRDVTKARYPLPHEDSMEVRFPVKLTGTSWPDNVDENQSFWFAQTLKYF
jgi:mannosyl-oligosaccharide alpha-1,2-mannosidase